MNERCSSDACKRSRSKRHRCPVNGIEYPDVQARTIAHHVKQPWLWKSGDQSYFFCDDPECEVAYFADDDSVLLTSQLRTQVGVKSHSENVPLCYCFGVSKADAKNNPGIREFVIRQTRRGACSCETSNPSGRCCLKDFPRANADK